MGSMSQGCGAKLWFVEADFSAPLTLCVLSMWRSGKLFTRTLAPMMQKYVDESIFRFREEERRQKMLWDVLAKTDLKESYHKKAFKALGQGFDEAHIKSEWGGCPADTLEMGELQDFVKSWMADFVSRAWDILETGIGGGTQEHLNFITTLFQFLTDPAVSCLPSELISKLESPPGENWPFILDAAVMIFQEEGTRAIEKAAKKRKNY